MIVEIGLFLLLLGVSILFFGLIIMIPITLIVGAELTMRKAEESRKKKTYGLIEDKTEYACEYCGKAINKEEFDGERYGYCDECTEDLMTEEEEDVWECKMSYQCCFGNREQSLLHMLETAKQKWLDCFHLFFDCLFKS